MIKAALNAEYELLAMAVDEAVRLLKGSCKMACSRGTFGEYSCFVFYEEPPKDNVKIVITRLSLDGSNNRVAIVPFYETPEQRVTKIMSYAVFNASYVAPFTCQRQCATIR